MVKNNHQLNLFKLYCSNLAIRQIYIYNISNPTVWSKSKSHKNATNIPKWNKSSRSRRLLCVTAVGAKLPKQYQLLEPSSNTKIAVGNIPRQKKSGSRYFKTKITFQSCFRLLKKHWSFKRPMCAPCATKVIQTENGRSNLASRFLSAALIELRRRAESATLCPDQNFFIFTFKLAHNYFQLFFSKPTLSTRPTLQHSALKYFSI